MKSVLAQIGDWVLKAAVGAMLALAVVGMVAQAVEAVANDFF